MEQRPKLSGGPEYYLDHPLIVFFWASLLISYSDRVGNQDFVFKSIFTIHQ
jgi:hypothetical protein